MHQKTFAILWKQTFLDETGKKYVEIHENGNQIAKKPGLDQVHY